MVLAKNVNVEKSADVRWNIHFDRFLRDNCDDSVRTGEGGTEFVSGTQLFARMSELIDEDKVIDGERVRADGLTKTKLAELGHCVCGRLPVGMQIVDKRQVSFGLLGLRQVEETRFVAMSKCERTEAGDRIDS